MRRLYGRPLDAILATWGLGIVIGQLITLVFGREVQFVPAPISGTLIIFGEDYSGYRLLMVRRRSSSPRCSPGSSTARGWVSSRAPSS